MFYYRLKDSKFPKIERLTVSNMVLPTSGQVTEYKSELEQFRLNNIGNLRCMTMFYSLKQIEFWESGLSCGRLDKDGIDLFLQMIIPQSPKNVELKCRLNNEITDEVKKNKQLWQIDEMKQNIKNEIDEKYKPKFDENELNELNDSNSLKNKQYKWHSQIELLSFVDFDRELESTLDEPISQYLMSQLDDSQRIKNGLSNLQSFECKYLPLLSLGEYQELEDLATDIYLCGSILNNTANQLTSLHIDNSVNGLWHWDFVKNEYPCTKESIQQLWFPANVEHLCWKHNNESVGEPFWYQINSTMFPKLKHLKIIDDGDSIAKIMTENTDRQNEIVSNVSSLVKNGLESLHIELNKLHSIDFCSNSNNCKNRDKQRYIEKCHRKEIVDICKFLKMVCQMVKSKKLRKQKTSREVEEEQFILKLELNVEFDESDKELGFDELRHFFSKENEEYFNKLGLQLLEIYSWMIRQYCRAMFGFRLQLKRHRQVDYDYLMSWLCILLEEHFDNQIVFQSDKTRSVDKVVTINSQETQVLVAAMFKNQNYGEHNISCQFCHQEPNYKYQCNDCRIYPWLQMRNDLE